MTHEPQQLFEPWLSNDPLQVFDWQEVFGNENPVEADLGAGDGAFILEWASRYPEHNFVATERLLGRARKIAKRSLRRELVNLRTLRLESHYFLLRMCPEASLHTIHIMFPDPWPKRKHKIRRLIQPDFIQAAHKALRPGGLLRFSTDHEEYFHWTLELWEQEEKKGAWERLGEWDASSDPQSDFQGEFETEGRTTHRCAWRKVQSK